MIGKVLGNRYEIIEQIGGGGMALVYKAKCKLLNRFVAIKILRDEFTEDEEFIKKFKRESQAAASMSHPNILNIYDVGVEKIDDKNIQYIVMEYIDGNTLKEVIKSRGKLSEDETIYYSLQISKALKHAHINHIVHRDIKPQNIMITKDNRVKVTDFGIAKAVSSSTIINSSDVLGSVHYSSPEQFRGGYVDYKSDIYSLGIVMYEMITGEIPYNGESPVSIALKHSEEDIVPPSKINANVSKYLESIILKSVQKRQGDRYESVEKIIQDLQTLKSSNKLINNIQEDESPTQVIPNVKNALKDEEVNTMKNIKAKKGKKNKSDGGIKMILLAIFLAFLVVSSVFFGYTRLRGYFDVSEVIVPDLKGMQEEEARNTLKDRGLKLNVVGTVKNSGFEEGQIANQSTEENSKVNQGFTIDVNISEGSGLVKVPGLVNKTIEEAERLLKDKGLSIGIPKYEYSEITPKDVVMKQEPLATELVDPGSKINLVISQGEEIKMVVMPNLVEKDIVEARNIISEKDLVVGEVIPQPSEDKKKGLVVWQSYEAGFELENKTAVDLYISDGPPTQDSEQTPEPKNPEEPKAPVEGKKNISLTLTPFTDRVSTEIKIISKKSGSSKEVYKKSHKGEDGDVVIELKGEVGSEFEVYFDDIYQFSKTIKE